MSKLAVGFKCYCFSMFVFQHDAQGPYQAHPAFFAVHKLQYVTQHYPHSCVLHPWDYNASLAKVLRNL